MYFGFSHCLLHNSERLCIALSLSPAAFIKHSLHAVKGSLRCCADRSPTLAVINASIFSFTLCIAELAAIWPFPGLLPRALGPLFQTRVQHPPYLMLVWVGTQCEGTVDREESANCVGEKIDMEFEKQKQTQTNEI